MAKTGRPNRKTTKNKNWRYEKFINRIRDNYKITQGIKSIFVDPNLSPEEKIKGIKDHEETNGDSAKYFSNAYQFAVKMIEDGNQDVGLLDKQLTEFREGYIERFFKDIPESIDEGLKLLPAFLKSQNPEHYATAQNEVMDEVINGKAENNVLAGADGDKLKAFLDTQYDTSSPEYAKAKQDIIAGFKPKDDFEKTTFEAIFVDEKVLGELRRDYSIGMLNNISNKVAEIAARRAEANKAAEYVEGLPERSRALLEEGTDGNLTAEAWEGLEKDSGKPKAELEKIVDVYRYSVKENLT
jgi:hypothetical protein